MREPSRLWRHITKLECSGTAAWRDQFGRCVQDPLRAIRHLAIHFDSDFEADTATCAGSGRASDVSGYWQHFAGATQLTTLCLSRCSAACAIAASAHVVHATAIQTLSILHTPLAADAAHTILANLAPLHALTALDLSHCSFDDSAAQAAASALAPLTQLRQLLVNHHRCGALGVLAVARACASLPALQRLGVAPCAEQLQAAAPLDIADTIQLAQHLGGLWQLTRLDLGASATPRAELCELFDGVRVYLGPCVTQGPEAWVE